jgi:subtilase family serine protease
MTLALVGSAAAAVASQPTNHDSTNSGRAVLAGSRPAWLATASDLGTLSPSAQVDNVRVYLAGRNPQGLAAFASSVSNPKSPDYKHYLSPAQVRARFGPTSAQVAAIRSWLTSDGLSVVGVNQHYVTVRGTAAQAGRAFGTTLDNFRTRTGVYRAPTGQLSVPAAVSTAVLGVTGLDNAPHFARPADAAPGPSSAYVIAQPCGSYFGQLPASNEPSTFGHTGSWVPCGYTPQQLRSAYGVDNPTYTGTGKGVTVAIVDAYASPTITSDVSKYTSDYGVPDFTPGQFSQSMPSAPWNSTASCGDWYTEESLDVEAVHNIAPGANITYVAAASCNDPDMLDAFGRIVDNKLATIVNNSWSQFGDDTEPQSVRAAYEQLFEQGAAEGIGFYFSTGDCGVEDPATPCGAGLGSTKPQANYPSDDPWVTAVGGTTLAIGSDGQQLWQAGWGDLRSTLNTTGDGWTPALGTGYPATWRGGSGGGASEDYAQPSYQAGIVPNSLSETLPDGTVETSPHRVIPDISMDADPNTGMRIGQTVQFADGTVKYAETRLGGTSLSCPLFVGMQALAQAEEGGSPLGFANQELYNLYDTPFINDVTDTPLGANNPLGAVRNDNAATNDPTSAITTHALAFGYDGQLHGTPGYDNETGLGAPSTIYVAGFHHVHIGATHR